MWDGLLYFDTRFPFGLHFAFAHLQDLFDELGLQSSPEKDCHPSTRMICLGILVDTEKMLFEVLGDRLSDLETELLQWTQFLTLTRRQFQSLLGKLSFVTAYVRPGRIFMSRLLNHLRSLPYKQSRFPVTSDMLSDIDWWLSFLPHFNGSAMIALPRVTFMMCYLPVILLYIEAVLRFLPNVPRSHFPGTLKN